MEVGFAIGLMIWSFIVAWNEARTDVKAIEKGDEIDHGLQLWHRIGLIGVPCLILAAAMSYHEGSLWPLVRLVAVSWASFTILFRVFINSMRGMDRRYLSPSNWYDRMIMYLSGFDYRDNVDSPYSFAQWLMTMGHQYHVNAAHRKARHKAGTLAYCFEASVLIAALATMIF